jgi:hypothetical protein
MTTMEWWTVPQAAVWIRSRDFDLVRGLNPRVELPMAMPGAFEARHLLRAARRCGWAVLDRPCHQGR